MSEKKNRKISATLLALAALAIGAALFPPRVIEAQSTTPYTRLREQTTCLTPTAGYVNVCAKTDKHVYSKDSDGTETDLSGGGGGGGGTLANDYAAGASTADSIMSIDSTRGPVVIRYSTMGTSSAQGRGQLFRGTSLGASYPGSGAAEYSSLLEFQSSYGQTTDPESGYGSDRWALQSRVAGAGTSTTDRLAILSDAGTGTYTERASFLSTGIVVPKIGTSSTTLHSPPTGTGDLCSVDASQTLTNKSISGATNTLSAIGLSSLSATGTPSASTFLRGDNTWSTPSGGVQLSDANTWTASQNVASVALSDGATISTNAALGNTFGVTIAGDRTIAAPTNLVSGGRYDWEIIQDGTGSRTLTWNSVFKFPAGVPPVLQTAAGAKDLIRCDYDGTDLLCASRNDVLTITATKTGSYTAVVGDVVRCDPSGGPFTVTLPTAVGVSGRSIIVKNITDSEAAVTVGTTSGQTIDGASTRTLDTARASERYVSDGTNWMVI